MKTATKPTSGFSLIEVMCAVLILGIGVVGLTQGITAALRSSKETEWQTAAALLAAGQVETLRAEGLFSEGETEGDGEEGLSEYHWKQLVKKTAVEGLFEVEVSVGHTASRGSVYSLNTLLFDPYTVGATNTVAESSGKKGSKR